MRQLLLLAAVALVGCRGEAPAPGPVTTGIVEVTPAAPSLPPPALPPPARPPYEAPLDVPIDELLTEYKANEIRADGRWKGKILRVSGTVARVGKGLGGEPFITIGTGATFELPVLQCFLGDPADPEALTLSAGGKATVQGRVDHLLGNVMAHDCVVNPMAQLCRSILVSVGGKRCSINPATGEARGVVFESNDQGSEGLVGTLDCVAPDDYADMLALLAPKHPVIVGSPRAGCYAMLGVTGKRRPFPEPLRVKLEAFFATL